MKGYRSAAVSAFIAASAGSTGEGKESLCRAAHRQREHSVMTLGLLGKKLGMTRIFDEAGSVIPVTVIQAGPCPILQIKNKERDGYTALQLGFDAKPERKVTKPMAGHFKRAGAGPVRLIREFRTEELDWLCVWARCWIWNCSRSARRSASPVFQKGVVLPGPDEALPLQSRPGIARLDVSPARRFARVASADPSHTWKGKSQAGHMGAASGDDPEPDRDQGGQGEEPASGARARSPAITRVTW